MSKDLKIKVCGMTQQGNLQNVDQLGIDYFGMIFHPSSKRFKDESPLGLESIKATPVGVFVNADVEIIKENISRFNLKIIQLHGNESVDYCRKIKSFGVEVWKVFGVDNNFDFTSLNDYIAEVDLFLFDTKSPLHGGTGTKFNWNLLRSLAPEIKFMLSGGIGPDDAQNINKLQLPGLVGIDINSKFESEPGLKNNHLVKQFLQAIRKT